MGGPAPSKPHRRGWLEDTAELDEVVDAEAAMIGRLTTLATELVAATGPLE
jgi:hypothetical protein